MKRKFTTLLLISLSFNSFSQDINKSNYTDLSPKEEFEISNRIINSFNSQREEAIKKALELNIPTHFKDENGYENILFYFENGTPIYKRVDNFGSAITARVNRINSGGNMGLNLNGQGMRIGVWDGGPIRTTHEQLLNRVTIGDRATFVTSDENTIHATHVAGTIAASGLNSMSKGLAYESEIIGYTLDNDVPEAISFARTGGLLSNHSYGVRIENASESLRGAYSSESKTWDDITNLYPYYLPVISAGNDRGKTADNTQGVDLLIGNKNSKNVVVVAAVNQVYNYVNANSVTMSTFSSWGPTDDFRIKPDISAKGVAVTSLSSESDNAQTTLQGTSMAAPAVTATLALFQQHYNNLFSEWMRSSMVKAIMINSADEAGSAPGPDYKFGWGLINGAAGVSLISNKDQSSILESVILNNSEVFEQQIVSNGNKLKATIAWTDPSFSNNQEITMNDRSSRLINDLDLRLTKDGVIYYPWVLDVNNLYGASLKADNDRDNVEQIEIDVPSGEYTLTVSHKNTLSSPQRFSLVVSNAVKANLSTEGISSVKFRLFPNPTYGTLNISSDFLYDYKVTVFDLLGRIVLSKVCNSNDNVLDLSNLIKGTYMVKLEVDNSIQTHKILVK